MCNQFCYGQVKSAYGSGQFKKDLDGALGGETGLVTSNAKSPCRVYLCRVTTGPSVGSQVSIGARPIVVGTHVPKRAGAVLPTAYLARYAAAGERKHE